MVFTCRDQQNSARFLWWGLATRTRKHYESAQRSYITFCKLSTTYPPHPVTHIRLCDWVGHLGYTHKSQKTIKGYVAGVRSSLVDLGLDDLDAFHHPLLERTITGIKRFYGETEKRERLPITRDILTRLITTFDVNNQTGATLHAAYCLAFAAFLRSGEITYSLKDLSDPAFASYHLTRRSIQLETDKLYVSLPASKTDPFRKGITLTVAASHDEACCKDSALDGIHWDVKGCIIEVGEATYLY